MEDSGTHYGELAALIIPNSDLPSRIFFCEFDNYLFFDADIRSSRALLLTLRDVATASLAPGYYVDIFAASDHSFMGRLDSSLDWDLYVKEINSKLRVMGDCDGLILVDGTRRWVVYQKRPVDVGIFAFDKKKWPSEIYSSVDDVFFSCGDIKNWLVGTSERDVSLVENFGGDYLSVLLENYCTEARGQVLH